MHSNHLLYAALLSLLLTLILIVPAEAQTIQRVEPPHWWTGMKNSQLQLLVYGERIGKLEALVDAPGIELKRTEKTDNPNYLFLYLEITKNARPGKINLKFQKNDKVLLSYPYELKQRNLPTDGSQHRPGFDQSDALYLITPDRFANGNKANDAFADMREPADRTSKDGRHGGDLRGIEERLDYISDLGFTAIWMNPLLENDMPAYSYHGYAATDFYKIDRRFGSNESYQAFCEKAGEKGIKVIMDMIVNHCGSEHWFFKDPPTEDWINFNGEFVPTSHRRNTVQDPYASEWDEKAFSDGWFVSTMPDLNQRNPLMADYLIQNAIWWIEYAGISGIRMDTYPYPDKDFMSRWTCEVMSEYPNFNIVGEEWTTNPVIVSYWQQGKKNHDGYISCLPALMDFPMQDALVRGLTEEEKSYGSGLIETYKALSMDFLYASPDDLVIFPDNHDMDRIFTQLGEDLDLFKQSLLFMATMRGIPQIYYGTEVLMSNSEHPNDHGMIRSDFPGGWTGDKVDAVSGKGLTQRQLEAQEWTRKLFQWRKDNPVIHHGKLMQFAPEDGIYVYFRYLDEKKVMVVLNKNDEAHTLELSRFKEMLADHKKADDILEESTIELTETLVLPPRTPKLLELK